MMKIFLKIIPKFWFLFALGLYLLLFRLPLPPQIQKRGILLDDVLILALVTLISFSFLWQSRFSKMAGLFFTLTIFTLPLLRIWQNAESNYNLVLGLLPWSDANGYYSDAVNLLNGHLFGSFSGRRPLFAGFLSTLLAFNDLNLQIVIILMTMVTAVSIFLLALTLSQSFHPIASFPVLILSQIYYRQIVGTTVTEQLGLPLGAIALGVLISFAYTQKPWRFALGIFLLTFALLARAGAFFIIPILALTGLWIFAKKGAANRKTIMLMTAAVVLPFLANAALQKLITVPGTEPTGNFSEVVYSQAKGGLGWQQARLDHPELAGLDEKNSSRAIYLLAFHSILENPRLLIRGLIKSFRDYFFPSQFAAFGFLNLQNSLPDLYLQIICLILTIGGMVICWIRRSEPNYAIVGAGLVGILISVPFVPPSFALWMRPYAATLPFTFTLVALAPIELVKFIRRNNKSQVETPQENNLLMDGLGILLVTCAFFGPLAIRATIQPQNKAHPCPTDELPAQFKIMPGTYLTLVENPAGFPSLGKETYEMSLDGFPGVYQSFAEGLRKPDLPALIIYTPEILSGHGFWIIAHEQIANNRDALVKVCIPANEFSQSVTQIKLSDIIVP
jgi:hypothetical protein